MMTRNEKLSAMGPDYPARRSWIRRQARLALDKCLKESTMRQYRNHYRRLNTFRDADGELDITRLGGTRYARGSARSAIVYGAARAARDWLDLADEAYKMRKAAEQAGDADALAQAHFLARQCEENAIAAGLDLLDFPPQVKGLCAQKQAIKQYKTDPGLRAVFDKPDRLPVSRIEQARRDGKFQNDYSKSHAKLGTTLALNKRYAQTSAFPGWHNLAFRHTPAQWKIWTAVASVCGCRPEEIAGAQFWLDPDNPGHLVFVIKGAKYDPTRGKGLERRWFSIAERGDSWAFKHLVDIAKAGPHTVQVPTTKKGRPIKNPLATFRVILNRVGEKFIKPGREHTLSLSPYCFRHSLACDLKAEQLSMKSIAIILGQATTKTQRIYGRAASGTVGKRMVLVDEQAFPTVKVVNDYNPEYGRARSPDLESVTVASAPVEIVEATSLDEVLGANFSP